MKTITIIIMLLMVVFMVGCTQVPPDNPSMFGPKADNDPYSCTTNMSGFVYYNNVSNVPYICNSTAWVPMVNIT